MRRPVLLPLLLLVAVALLSRPAWAQDAQASDSIVVVKVDGSIDDTQASYLRDSLAEAEADGSTVVIQLDSAGTLDQDAVALAERIHSATVPVVVWVGPTPAKAQGAAHLFLYAASLGAVAPGVGIGPLEPLDLVDARNEDLPNGRELEELARVGVGGVEITPIYGARGYEDRYIDFLSPQWIDMLEHVGREAKRLGLGVDMATGTG